MRVRRLEILDEYVENGRAAVYTSREVVVVLSELATAAWLTIGREWMSTTEVVTSLVGEFGEPTYGGTDDLTLASLRVLAEMGLIQLEG